MTHFVNDHSSIVQDSLSGLLMASGRPGLGRLDGFPDIRVVLRTERDPSCVAVISGGGSGHEPAHAGFVAEGLLDAAVCGDIFASPTTDAVLATILAVAGPAGCLLIVKNYNGDRLNFGLAAERGRAMGLAVEMVIVADDVALPHNPRPRGIAGTLLVHKVAGHAASQGLPLAEVLRRAQKAADRVRSIGAATISCSIPGRNAVERIPAGEVEYGLGIHGEAGIERAKLPEARKLIDKLLARFDADLLASPRLALLLNSLGGVPVIEMNLLAESLLASKVGPRIELMCGPAVACSALDMRGFSISLLPLDEELTEALTAPVICPDWPTARLLTGCQVTLVPLPAALKSTDAKPSDHPAVRRALATICQTLFDARRPLDALDAKVGDGDTGSTFARAAQRIQDDLDRLPLADPQLLCAALVQRLSRVMGGSSGVLLSIFVAAVGAGLGAGQSFHQALRTGAERMQHYGGAAKGDRTMLDALLPAIDALGAGEG
ncbi:MAG: dihydroxyacetone kinase subunit DhaK, partial [Aquabacterium sp.]